MSNSFLTHIKTIFVESDELNIRYHIYYSFNSWQLKNCDICWQVVVNVVDSSFKMFRYTSSNWRIASSSVNCEKGGI